MNKAFLLSLILIVSGIYKAQASHIAGAEIYYEYIGDSTGIPYHYMLYLNLFRDGGGSTAGLGPTYTVDIQSPCGNQNIDVNRYYLPSDSILPSNGAYVPEYARCIPSSTSLAPLEIHRYKEDVYLPGQCLYTFSWSQCCRNAAIENIEDPDMWGLYIESILDNTNGPNSSPAFKSAGIRGFCAGQSTNWPQTAIDEDGDSLFYALTTPLDGTGVPMIWDPNFSAFNPISTLSGVYLDQSNGTLSFTPAKEEIGVLSVIVEEYREGSPGTWQLVGTTARDVQYVVVSNCDFTTNDPAFQPTYASTIPKLLHCGTKTLQIDLSLEISCGSIASDGSDFSLTNSHGDLFPVVAAGPGNCSLGYTGSLWVELYDNTYYNDTLYLTSRVGNDRNTLNTECGFSFGENDSLKVIVVNCTTDVSLLEQKPAHLILYPNPVAAQEMHIQLANGGSHRTVEIWNLQGRKLRSFALTGTSAKLDLPDLPPGLYVLRVIDSEGSVSRTFSKL